MIEDILNSGFIDAVSEHFKYRFNPNNGFFGCTTWHPDMELVRGNKSITFSLQGVLFMDWLDRNPKVTEEQEILIRNLAVRYIQFKMKDRVLYENISGKLPSEKFIRMFIKTQ